MLFPYRLTLVFATGGVDLSVWAIMAISGAIAATVIRSDYAKGALEYGVLQPLYLVIGIPLLFSLLAGLLNWLLAAIIGIQPIIGSLILIKKPGGTGSLRFLNAA